MRIICNLFKYKYALLVYLFKRTKDIVYFTYPGDDIEINYWIIMHYAVSCYHDI